MDSKYKMTLRIWVSITFLLAGPSFLVACAFLHWLPSFLFDELFVVALICSLLWPIVVAVGFVVLRRRALWLLTSAPLALFCPIILALFIHQCGISHDCL